MLLLSNSHLSEYRRSRLEVKSQLCTYLLGRPWGSHLASLGFCLSYREMRVMIFYRVLLEGLNELM